MYRIVFNSISSKFERMPTTDLNSYRTITSANHYPNKQMVYSIDGTNIPVSSMFEAFIEMRFCIDKYN